MKNSKLLLILLPIATLLFWYLGRPPAQNESPAPEHPAPKKVLPDAPPAAPTGKPSAPPANTFVVAAQEPRSETTPSSAAPQTATPPASTGDIETPAPKPLPATGNPDITPDQKLEALRHTFRTYASRHKGNPVGDNAEITAALAGKNPGTANYLADAPHGLNDKGQLCDGWGTPYFFHQLSGTEMEIRSAGPDQKMFTPDDLVTK